MKKLTAMLLALTLCFGIRETRLIYAECLDICGNDPEAILQSAIDQIERSADR